jgi:hypothetical protein
MPRIEPTLGRIVHYEPHPGDPGYNVSPETRAAIIAGINEDGTVNLAVFDRYGRYSAITSVRLVQDNEIPPETGYAHWPVIQPEPASDAIAIAKSTRAKRVAAQAEPEADDDI